MQDLPAVQYFHSCTSTAVHFGRPATFNAALPVRYRASGFGRKRSAVRLFLVCLLPTKFRKRPYTDLDWNQDAEWPEIEKANFGFRKAVIC